MPSTSSSFPFHAHKLEDEQSSARGAVAGFRNEGADSERLIRQVAVDTEAARHRRAVARVVGCAAPAVEAELERLRQNPAVVGLQVSVFRRPIHRCVLNGGNRGEV